MATPTGTAEPDGAAIVEALQALLVTIPADHPAYEHLMAALAQAEQYAQAQREAAAAARNHPEDYWAARWRV